MTKTELHKFLTDSKKIKPEDFIVDDLKWRYLLWATSKGKNILLLGPTRCGKTKAAISTAHAFYEIVVKDVNEDELSIIKNDTNKKIIKIEEL